MVKEKNYNHREIGLLRNDDLNRIKVFLLPLRKPSESLPRRSKR
jgi:hypothetical protein